MGLPESRGSVCATDHFYPCFCSPQATTWKLSMIPGRLYPKHRHPANPLSTFQRSSFPVTEEFMGIREALDFPDTRLLGD